MLNLDCLPDIKMLAKPATAKNNYIFLLLSILYDVQHAVHSMAKKISDWVCSSHNKGFMYFHTEQ